MREIRTSGSTRGEWVARLASPSLLLYRLRNALDGLVEAERVVTLLHHAFRRAALLGQHVSRPGIATMRERIRTRVQHLEMRGAPCPAPQRFLAGPPHADNPR